MGGPLAYRSATSTSTATGFELESSGDEDDVRNGSAFASTSVCATVLGFSDGYVSRGGADLSDWRTSRMGGQPCFPPLSVLPSSASSTCLSCGSPMPLLVQIYAPLDLSPSERVVYTFACPSRSCKGVAGSVRAFRAGRFWPREVAAKEQKAPESAVAGLGSLIFASSTATPVSVANPFNPFAPRPAAASNPFMMSSNPFAPPPAAPIEQLGVLSLGEEESAEPEPPSLAWSLDAGQPAYPPQYLTTAYEPTTPIRRAVPLPSTSRVADPDAGEDHFRSGKAAGGRVKKGAVDLKKGGGIKGASAEGVAWGSEGYEVQKVLGVDEIFLRFQERVSREGQQCVRYEHNSTPLPFSISSPNYAKLFVPNVVNGTVDSLGTYRPSLLPRCATCGEPRVFEYQLMPYLVTLLNRSDRLDGSTATERAPGRPEEGLDWASVLVFTCRGECMNDGESWREEHVLVEWED